MLPRALKGVVILVLGGLVAILLGKTIGEGDYESLLLLCYLSLGMFVLTAPGYLPLLALGLLNPFMFPIPFVHNFPFLALMFGVCVIKLILRDTLTHNEFRNYQPCLTLWMAVFFGWVALRYLMKPVMPNLSGFGGNITGFRSYLNYGICFALVVGLPYFVKTRQDVLKLFKWMAGISVFFACLLIPLVFSKSSMAAFWLQRLGLFVAIFDNGWLRFVVLPGFGITLITLSMFPTLLPVKKLWQRVFLCLGIIAVIMGGTRSGALMAVAVILTSLALRRQYARLAAISTVLAALVLLGTYLGENVRAKSGFGFLRIMALTSKRVARQTEAGATWEWRQNLWDRAIREIKKNPVFGKGYGGLENAWVFSTQGEFNQAEGDISLAAGGIHNGYLATAYTLGIPGTLLFLLAFGQVLRGSIRQIVSLREADPVVTDMQQFAFANLLSLLVSIFIGTDLNGPIIWFYLTLSVLIVRIKETEIRMSGSEVSTATALPLSARPATG